MEADKYEALKRRYSRVTLECEVCASQDLEPFQAYGRVAEAGVYGEMPVTICRTCGFKMQNPRYEDDFYREYYDIMYREIAFDATRPSDSYINEQKERGAGVLAFVKDAGIPPGHMLDHGCASGATMLAWMDTGWTACGIDPHRPSVESGRALGLEIEVGVGEALPFRDGAFDLVLSLGSLEHSYDLAASMSEIRRVLRPGGHLVIRWRSNVIFGSPLEYYNHNHYRFFTPATWTLALARWGFETMSTTDRKLEGWDSYSYIIAQRTDAVDPAAVTNLIAAGACDDWSREVEQLRATRHDYLERCRRFVDLHDRFDGDAEGLIATIRRDHADLRWGFLGGNPDWVVNRARMEADRYLSEFEAGHVR